MERRIEDLLALPRGGGAIRGLGESFSPDPFTGTGNLSIPIDLPPGRNGMQPRLSLSYSTANGNSPFGLGWGLEIPRISRLTTRGVPRYDDGDVFVFAGGEELVPLGAPPAPATPRRYRPRTEGRFARIERIEGAGAADRWEVRTTDGLLHIYGAPARAGHEPAVLSDPARPGRIFAWLLTSTIDPVGNRIEYQYRRDRGADGLHRFDQLYLAAIRYADHGDGRFLVHVDFEHEERPDPFSSHRGGFELRTRLRCARIAVTTEADVRRAVRTVHLDYLDRLAEPEALPANAVSLLARVRVVGHDGDTHIEMPPVDVEYGGFDSALRRLVPVTGPQPPAGPADPDHDFVDLFGRGLPDVVQIGVAGARYWRNEGNGRLAPPRSLPRVPAGVALGEPGVHLLDADGDGRADVMVVREGLAGTFPMSFDGAWDERRFRPYDQAPSFPLDDPEVRLIDLDGDGVTDAVRTGEALECFFQSRAGWSEPRRVRRRDASLFPDVSFSDPRVKVADMSGDGLADIVLVHDGHVDYWPNLGHGDFAPRVSMSGAPPLPADYDPRRVLLGDVDGDGLADLLYVDGDGVTLWINQGGRRFAPPIHVCGLPRVSDGAQLRLVDFLGTGVAGLLITLETAAPGRPRMYFLDFTGGVKPYLLHTYRNGCGGSTRVSYATSTAERLRDDARPATRWRTPLPFPVQVVKRVATVDAITGVGLTTEYLYHHGYWNGLEREFRGFGRVDHRDTTEGIDAAGSAPAETRIWFHVGAIDGECGAPEELDLGDEHWREDPRALPPAPGLAALLRSLPLRGRQDALRSLRGRVLRSEIYGLDGSPRQDRPYQVDEQAYDVREIDAPPPGDPRPRIFFAHEVASRTTQWERGAEPRTRLAFSGDHDAFGQVRRAIEIAVPRGRDYRVAGPAGEPYLATARFTDYALRDGARLIADRVSRVTSWEIVNDGSAAAAALHDAVVNGTATRRITGQTLHFYDGAPFEGLPFGKLGEHGLLVRTEQLAFTPEILRDGYRSGPTPTAPPETPPYLAPGSTVWTADYPADFRAALPPLAGYTFQAGGPGSPYVAGYFVAGERVSYDVQVPGGSRRGLVLTSRDPLRRDTVSAYDPYGLLVLAITDPAGLVTRVVNDYRVLAPLEVIDPNGTRSWRRYNALGFPVQLGVIGAASEGDTEERPGTRHEYDIRAFIDRGQPVSVRTIKRLHHASDASVPAAERDATIETVEYSDGLGRSLQTRTRAEDVVFGATPHGEVGLPAAAGATPGDAIGATPGSGTRVSVSAWTVRDNKGRTVAVYEPFFAMGWEYGRPGESELGERTGFHHDPVGRLVLTRHPDGTEERAVPGIPARLDDPDDFAPTPWETYRYDSNDLAARTHPERADLAACWGTPSSVVMDALDRIVESVLRPGREPGGWLVTRNRYDVRGNMVETIDPVGRATARQVVDLMNRSLRQESIDGGVERKVHDAAGAVRERRDGKGALVLDGYSPAGRLNARWARDRAGAPVTMRERVIYGEEAGGPGPAAARAGYLLGQLYRHHDEAGLLTFEAYDFKGNVLEKVRQVWSDRALLDEMTEQGPGGGGGGIPPRGHGPPEEHWPPRGHGPPHEGRPPFGVGPGSPRPPAGHPGGGPPGGGPRHDDLDPEEYRVTYAYNALNQIVTALAPVDVERRRRRIAFQHDRSGSLVRVDVDGAVYIAHIAYNARGQRLLVAAGSGVMSRYAYDRKTFRLSRLRSERYDLVAPHRYRGRGPALLDLAYDFDLVGNPTRIADRTPGSGTPGGALGADALDRLFAYDPIYRLRSATGRSCAAGTPALPWQDAPRCQDPSLTRPYTETYDYDRAGNLTVLRHSAGPSSYTRSFAPAPDGNRLLSMSVGATVHTYEHDGAGNLIREGSSRRLDWDHSDRLRGFRVATGDRASSSETRYVYDASGTRVKKLSRTQAGHIESTIYIDALFERRRAERHGPRAACDFIHVLDGGMRVAELRIGRPLPEDELPAIRFHLVDHLGSSGVLTNGEGIFVNREEHLPYGETSFGGAARKRYRFTGKERDDESGLAYHGARYYAPWLARWASCDPQPPEQQDTLYSYGGHSPLRFVDPDGEEEDEAFLARLAAFRATTMSRDDFTAWSRERFETWRTPYEAAHPPGVLDREIADQACYFSPLWMHPALGPPEDEAWPMTGRIDPIRFLSPQQRVQMALQDLDAIRTNPVAAVQYGVCTALGESELERHYRTQATASVTNALGMMGGPKGKLGLSSGQPSTPRPAAYHRRQTAGEPSSSKAAKDIRAAAKGKPCPECGSKMNNRSNSRKQATAEHEPELVVAWYRAWLVDGKPFTWAQFRDYARSAASMMGALCRSCNGAGGRKVQDLRPKIEAHLKKWINFVTPWE